MSHKRQITVRITRNRYPTKSYIDQDFGKFNQDRLFFLSCCKAYWDKEMRLVSTYITSTIIIIIIIITIIIIIIIIIIINHTRLPTLIRASWHWYKASYTTVPFVC